MKAYAFDRNDGKLTRRVKHLAGLARFRADLYKVLTPNCAIVVLFHRVDDKVSDENKITCSRRKFAEFCDFFAKYYTLITYKTLLEKIERNDDLRGHIVITFDDGYRDNHAAAAELKKRGIPACFFIATGFIGTERVAWWDAEAGVDSEWMNWDQVRELKRLGFELGAHTVNHLDLGVIKGDEAQWEIEESKRKLESEVGGTIDLFSYRTGDRINAATRIASGYATSGSKRVRPRSAAS